MSPLIHGVETDLQTMSSGSPTLAEVLRGSGYRTAGVFSGPYLESVWGFGRGFDRYSAAYGPPVAASSTLLVRLSNEIVEADRAGDAAMAEELRWLRRAGAARIGQLSSADVSSARVTAQALDELARFGATPDPWFLFVHYFDVHYDYAPPPPFDRRFDPAYAGYMTGVGFTSNAEIAVPDPSVPDGYVRRVSNRDLEHLRALYAGEAAWVDEHVGQLLTRLDAVGLTDRTLVIVVSDHGDEFFEQGGIGHRRNVAEAVIRVPVLLRLPGRLPAGHAEPGLTSLTDVMPTVLDLVGGANPAPMSGRSLLPLGHRAEEGEKRPLLSRLVRIFDGVMHTDETNVPMRTAVVQEAFRFRSMKIVRRRRWMLLPPALPEAVRERVQREANEEFRREELVWIDLAQSPEESPSAYSADFRDPRAHHALGVVRSRYRTLRAARTLVVGTDPKDAILRSKLVGLGYLQESEAPTSPRQGFLLPAPGDRDSIPQP